jgi:Rrf2 family protein
MQLNKSVTYAIVALAQIAADESGKPLPNSVICQRTGMPDRFELQILRHLVNAGLVTSLRGVNGGYKLARPAHQITIWDVCEAIDPAGHNGLKLDGLTSGSQRTLTAALDGVMADARKRLAAVTIADLKLAKA